MAKQTLFQILSRQPWWLTLLVAVLIFSIMQFVFPPLAPFVALPFAAVAAYLAWRQLRAGPSINVEERLAALRAMPWENFSLVVSEAYRRKGYTVEASTSAAFDFKLTAKGRITLVQCRRWKVNQVGDGPVRELVAAMEKHNAYNCVCITAGEFSTNAHEFARGRPVTLLAGAALAQLVGTIDKKGRRWFAR
jgi:restriction system protein